MFEVVFNEWEIEVVPTESVRLEWKSTVLFNVNYYYQYPTTKTITEKLARRLLFLYNRKDIDLNERGELDV